MYLEEISFRTIPEMDHDPRTWKKTDAYNTAPPQDTIAQNWLKLNSVRFEEPYEHINPMDNTHEDIHIIGTQEKDIEYDEVEQK